MAITLDAIALPHDLVWADEHGWSNVTQAVDRALDGALIVQEATQPKGRIITLSGSQNSGWISKTVLDSVLAQANTVDNTMVLTFHGETYDVMFHRSGNKSPVDAKAIVEYSDRAGDDRYSIVLNFIEV